jgi:Domain of Unknown Function (DUF1080)
MIMFRGKITRRRMLEGAVKLGLAAATAPMVGHRAFAAPVALTLPDAAASQRESFETGSIVDWTVVSGQWTVNDMAGAPSGKRVLVQQSVQNTFNVIVAPFGPYSDVDVTVKFKPISGQEDASGGIVFRFTDGRYYLIRANGLEDNFRLYYYDNSRHMLANARVAPPTLGQWHTLRAVVVGDHVQGWLNGALLLDYRDARFKAGRIGLWTKADSITAFDDLTIRGIPVRA